MPGAGPASAGDRQQGQRAQSEGRAGSQRLQTECRRKGACKGAGGHRRSRERQEDEAGGKQSLPRLDMRWRRRRPGGRVGSWDRK